MSQNFKTPITLKLRRSFLLTVVLLLSHIGALSCVLYVPVPLILKFFLVVAILLAAIYFICRYSLLILPVSVTAIVVYDEGGGVTLRNHETYFADIDLSECISTDSMIVLTINFDERRYRIPVFRDMVDIDVYRKLRVYLKIS